MPKYEVRELAYLVHKDIEADNEAAARRIVAERLKGGFDDYEMYNDDISDMVVELVEGVEPDEKTFKVTERQVTIVAYQVKAPSAEAARKHVEELSAFDFAEYVDGPNCEIIAVEEVPS